MTTFPVSNYWNNAARTEAEQKGWGEDFLATTKQLAGAGGAHPTYTIAGGSITPASTPFGIETEGGASTDDLTNIQTTNFPDGWIIFLRPINATHAVVVKHAAGGSGQIVLANAADLTLNNTTMWLTLYRNGTQWQELGRWYGNAVTGFKNYYQVAGLGQNTFTGRQEWKQGANLASASTITLGTDGNVFVVTGTATVNGLSSAPAGTTVILLFNSSDCLLVDSINFILQSGSYYTRAGDCLQFISHGGGLWREVGALGTSRVLDIRTSGVPVSNTGAETVVYSRIVPPNALGTKRRLKVTLLGAWRFGAGVALGGFTWGLVFKLYYGGTLVAATAVPGAIMDASLNLYAFGTTYAGCTLTAILGASGTTTSQWGQLTWQSQLGGQGTGGTFTLANAGIALGVQSTDLNGGLLPSYGNATENSMIANNIAITAMVTYADPTNEYIMTSATMEMLP